MCPSEFGRYARVQKPQLSQMAAGVPNRLYAALRTSAHTPRCIYHAIGGGADTLRALHAALGGTTPLAVEWLLYAGGGRRCFGSPVISDEAAARALDVYAELTNDEGRSQVEAWRLAPTS